MTDQISGYVASLFVHIFIVVAAFGLMGGMSYNNKPLSIDFRIDSREGKVVENPRPPQKKVVKKIVPPPKQHRMPEPPPKKVPKFTKKTPIVLPEKIVPVKEVEPAEEEVVEEIEEVAEVELGDREVEAVNEISEEEYLQQIKSQFLRAHFQYIRENIQNKVVYPRLARKRGWQGKVVVKFVVCEDGHVVDVEIIESSGFSVLDDNAIKSVRNAAPFPRPPVRTELIIPIRFGLV